MQIFISALTGLPCPCCPPLGHKPLGLPDSIFSQITPVSTSAGAGILTAGEEDKSKEKESIFSESVAELRRKALEHTRQQFSVSSIDLSEMAKDLENQPKDD